jgi:hypothetical protein
MRYGIEMDNAGGWVEDKHAKSAFLDRSRIILSDGPPTVALSRPLVLIRKPKQKHVLTFYNPNNDNFPFMVSGPLTVRNDCICMCGCHIDFYKNKLSNWTNCSECQTDIYITLEPSA